MRLSQSGSVSSPKEGSGNRLGRRTRKKHKKLDAISEDVFNRNRRAKTESSGGTSKGESVDNDSELRRSSRVRRAPTILDASPPPPKKRRKNGKLGKKGHEGSVEKSRGKGRPRSKAAHSSSESSEDEELGAWRSRLRAKAKSDTSNLKGSGNRGRPRGKKKLFEDFEEDVEEPKSVKNELEDEMPSSEGEKSRGKSTRPGRGRAFIDNEDELHDDPSGDEGLENGVDASRNEDDGDCDLLARGRTDENEEKTNGSPATLLGKESEVAIDTLEQEKQNMDDNMKDSEQNDEQPCSPKLVEDAENQRLAVEVARVVTDQVEDDGCDDAHISADESKEKHMKQENDAKVGNHNVTAVGIPKSRIKEGRRCGLCGGGTDGKPPKRLANDSTGSDHEAYSGSSATDEFTYDVWDGFGDEPGWLGRLLGPINDRYGIAGIWVHQHCAVWSPEVYFAGLGCLKNIRAALCRGKALKCTRCGRRGATLGCRVDRCPRTYHLPCARASGCIFDHRKFLIACADHRYIFEPHGHQYLQRIKKLKAKKMKLEIRKLSNDASRKDVEAEEKWMEKCGEDEEFLRRETKRLQRDLLRIAPVYIGGCQSEGDNLFEGWESVAGLQDVVTCMKEVVILPLLYPEFFDNMGITPPRGVLLHGYPGTGKTLVVRALIGACARGDKRIAYFARKGADCLGKYVGDAERQLRLLFQVAEKSQPSIIFFDEIDGLAPVRTRQQDQTHSSVVSTLLALMDGLKSRGSVIVIGATNRPDAVDPALRRPGRFDREIYFPLPSVKDRASILALHTRKWPKPVAGPLLDWVATNTVGFAGADLQALCAQSAVIALKRNCNWQKILSSAEDNYVQGKRMQLPTFAVEERDWLEALSLAPPPCSRREAGMAATEVVGSPLHIHLIPCLLQPLLNLIISLYLDDRLWLPRRLINAGEAIKKTLVSFINKRSLQSDRWWCYAPSMIQESDTAREIVSNLSIAGILDGGSSFTKCDLSNDESFDVSRSPCSLGANPGLFRNYCFAQSKKPGYRVLIAGDPRSGQKHLASCLLHCFVGSIEMQKIDLATISQEGHGDMEQGISHILMKCADMKLRALVMPRIDLWAIQSVQKDDEASPDNGSSEDDSSTSSQIVDEKRSSLRTESELVEVAEPEDELWNASQTWNSFVEQFECLSVSSSLIILATSELPLAVLPHEVRQFFGSDPLTSEGSVISEYSNPRISVEVDGVFDQDMLIHSSALDLSRDLIQQFVHLVHQKNHVRSHSSIVSEAHSGGERDTLNDKADLKSVEEPGARKQLPESSITKTPVPSSSRNEKGKSALILAISTFGYQILRYPHFAELCWVTSKLTEGPSADIHGPWKGWPFNSCIIRPCKSVHKETTACSSNNIKGKDKFTLVRGLVAVALSAYRGTYTSPTEVSLEVRKVLQLLVAQIGARIQSGKDRYQFIRLLSQVAYLEDMVNNWVHSLRSLEPDAQTMVMNPKSIGGGSPDDLQTPADNLMQVEEQPNIQDDGLEEPEHVEGGLQGSIAENSALAEGGLQGPIAGNSALAETMVLNPRSTCGGSPDDLQTPADDLMQVEEQPNILDDGLEESERVEGGLQGSIAENSALAELNRIYADLDSDDASEQLSPNIASPEKVVSSSHIATEICFPGESANLVNDSPEGKVNTGFEASAVIDQSRNVISNEKNNEKCEGLRSKNPEHLSVVEQMQPTQRSSDFAHTESPGQLSKLVNIEICRSSDVCNQSNTVEVVENEISADVGKNTSDTPLPDFKIPSESNSAVSSESEAVCSYSCCVGCISNLHQLVKKIVSREWKLSSSCTTVEDVHDLVSSLSTSLCSTVRNFYVTGGSKTSINGKLNSETCRNVLVSQETSDCHCESSENRFNSLAECACHLGCQESNLSSYNQLGFNPRYVFRDGVLISAEPDKDSSLHCKYGTLCLCSLIELIAITKQPLD